MDIRITRQSLRDAEACYDDNEIAALIPEAGVNLDEGLALYVPVEDKHWVLCHAAGVPDQILREHACWCACRALEAERAAGREPDQRSWAAVAVAELFARGEATQYELDAAWAAARDAACAASDAAWAAACAADSAAASATAWDAASATAWDAARAAAYAAARADAYADARAAARAAASDAAWAAARAAAWDAQLSDLVARIRNA
jgi:hypothetical protein